MNKKSKTLFILVVLIALGMSWYSMTDLGTNYFSLPFVLSVSVSLAFDLGAIFLGLVSIEYAKTNDSGVLAELGTFLLVAVSVYVNVSHAYLANYGLVGMVMFGFAPVIVGVMLKVYLNFVTRQARKNAGRIVERLPVAGKLTWLRYPKQSWHLMSIAMQHRLLKAADELSVPQDNHRIFAKVETGQSKPSETAVDKTEKTSETQPSIEDKKPEQLSQPEIKPQLTSADKPVLPVWLPHEPDMKLATIVRTCVDNSVFDIETIYRYAVLVKGQDVNKASLRKTLDREKAKAT